MENSSLLSRLPEVRGRYRENVALGKMCWFGVGGRAEVVFIPADIADLQHFLINKPADVPCFVFGVGSNTLIRDGGIDGVVIRLGGEFNYIQVQGEVVTAGAAVMDVNLANYACQAGLTGLEFMIGIPGTVGGALAMNAGAYGSDTATVLLEATAVNSRGELQKFAPQEIGYGYRHKDLSDEWIFVEAKFQARPGDIDEIQAKMDEIKHQRGDTQPVRAKTGGSTFKNPEGHKAWQLIDQAGLRGAKVGGAIMSEKHCNFLINEGDATAADIEQLIALVKEEVLKKTGVQLEAEIKIVGKGQ
jgi:UDP-N-acetylmuramate dehydrogenase